MEQLSSMVDRLRADRRFSGDRHLRNLLLDGEWLPLFDEAGNQLVGIRGKEGAYGPRDLAGLDELAGAIGVRGASEEIGVDLLELQPGAAFPLHVHPGDHILIGALGAGTIRVEGVAYPITPGTTVFVAADLVHGVGTHESLEAIPEKWGRSRDAFVLAAGTFRLYAVGVPHKHVSAEDRMLLVDDPGAARDRLADEGEATS